MLEKRKREDNSRKGLEGGMRELITDSACLTVSVFPSASEMIFKERKEGGWERRDCILVGLPACEVGRDKSLFDNRSHNALGWEKTA